MSVSNREHSCPAQPSNQGIVFESLAWKLYSLGGGAPRLVMAYIKFCPFCGQKLEVPNFADEAIAGKAQCGCVYHAEEGIPCEHDRALAALIK
jgi:hypothetical protein